MSSSTASLHPLSAGRYARVVARRWVVVVLMMLLGAGLAAAYLTLRPPMATASTLVNLNVIAQEPFNIQREPSGLIDAETENQTARSSQVLSQAAERLGGTTAAELRDGLEANLLPDGTVLRLSYTAPTVAEATATADEIARRFLEYRTDLADARVSIVLDRLTERRDLLRDDVQRLAEEIAGAPNGSLKEIQARGDRQVLNAELDAVLAEAGRLANVDTTGGTVITEAADVGAYVSPRRSVVLAAGALAGLLLGLVGAFVRERWDRRVLDATDLEALEAEPLLARVPARTAVPPAADAADAARSVWERLDAGLVSHRPILSVLDLGPTEAAYAVAASLACVAGAGDGGARLVLMGSERHLLRRLETDLDLRQVEETEDAVTFRSGVRPHLVVNWVREVRDEAARVRTLEKLLRDDQPGRPSRGRAVVAVPPSGGRALRMSCGRLSDATLVVVPERLVHKQVVRAVRDDLAAVGATFLGSVLLHGRGPVVGQTSSAGREKRETSEPLAVPAREGS